MSENIFFLIPYGVLLAFILGALNNIGNRILKELSNEKEGQEVKG